MTAQTLGYVRVSSADQNTDRQLDMLKPLKPSKIFSDKLSGATTKRPALDALLEHARSGDTILICSLDRLGRNLLEVTQLLKGMHELGLKVSFIKEAIDYDPSNPFSQLMINQMLAFAQFEREIIKQRQAEGIEAAKQRGKTMGRPALMDAKALKQAKAMMADGMTMTDAAINLGVGRTTLWRALKAA